MEYKDGDVWKPVFPTSTTISKSGEFTITLANDNASKPTLEIDKP